MTDAPNNLTPQQMLTYMYNFGLEGHIVDHTWYEIFRFRKGTPEEGEEQQLGKPHLQAITLLSDIVYWYRPTVEKSDTGKVSIRKRFRSDILQRNYTQIEESFGLTDRESKSAMQTLEYFGVAKRVFRTITEKGMKISNVMYISFDPIRLKQLMDNVLEKRVAESEEREKDSKKDRYDVETSHPPHSNVTPPTFKRHTNTETSSETSTKDNNNPPTPHESKVATPKGSCCCSSLVTELIRSLPITEPEKHEIAKEFGKLDDSVFKAAVEAYRKYAAKEDVKSHVAVLRRALSEKWTPSPDKQERASEAKQAAKERQDLIDRNSSLGCEIWRKRLTLRICAQHCSEHLELKLDSWPSWRIFPYDDINFVNSIQFVLKELGVGVSDL